MYPTRGMLRRPQTAPARSSQEREKQRDRWAQQRSRYTQMPVHERLAYSRTRNLYPWAESKRLAQERRIRETNNGTADSWKRKFYGIRLDTAVPLEKTGSNSVMPNLGASMSGRQKHTQPFPKTWRSWKVGRGDMEATANSPTPVDPSRFADYEGYRPPPTENLLVVVHRNGERDVTTKQSRQHAPRSISRNKMGGFFNS